MTLPIMNASHVWHCSLVEHAGHVARQVKMALGVDIPAISAVARAPAIVAHVNHNRWIVSCPDCHSAEYLWPDTPLFLCSNCLNGSVKGRWRKVKVPKEREAIERALRARPGPANRNWGPGESVADLVKENLAHHLDGGAD